MTQESFNEPRKRRQMVASGKRRELKRTKRSLWNKNPIKGRALTGRADDSALICAHLAARGSLLVSETRGCAALALATGYHLSLLRSLLLVYA